MKILFYAFITVFLIFSACSEKEKCTTCPEAETCDYPAGNRSFSWRVDTVAFWPSFLGGVHAFAVDDAYLMGYIGEGKAPWRIFVGKHWNGTEWETNIHGTDAEVGHVANDVTGDDHFMVSVGNWSITPPKPALGEFDNRTKKWKSYQFETEGELTSVWTDGKGFFIAVGWNGMVYTKDGYKAEWVYNKAPTDFHFAGVTGLSKNEIYISAGLYLETGEEFQQGWKYYNEQWIKLYDTMDTTGTPLQLTAYDYPHHMAVWRCSLTDSLKLYVIGDQSYLFSSEGQQLDFQKINLTKLGLYLKPDGRTGLRVYIFNPNDIWVVGTRFNFYHWNGVEFARMFLPGLPDDDTRFGIQTKFVKTKSGKMFIPSEVSSQVWVVLQGTP